MSKTKKIPLIDLLAAWCQAQGLAADREQLLAAIMCGDLKVEGERCREARRDFKQDSAIELAANSPLWKLTGQLDPRSASQSADGAEAPKPGIPDLPFVSRGGSKLDSVLELWHIPVRGRVWLDAGCSTGGFTHCLLHRGAAVVHAVDVGYNLLDWRLRNLESVKVHERCNIMGINELTPRPEAAVADLSFRSMQGAAKKILSLTADNELYALIKPQFERKYSSPEDESADGPAFHGVVGLAETKRILSDLAARLGAEGVALFRLAPAGLKGRSGNQEYVAQLSLAEANGDSDGLVSHNRLVVSAHFAR